ncbi:MAG: hypothetical protein ACREAK_00670 [Nitrosarchaeum sp.]
MNEKKLFCNTCGQKSALLIWDERYSGYRGKCPLCGGNWPES